MKRRKKRGRYKYTSGIYTSPKVGKVFYKSSYELRYYKILDHDISVLNYIVEPFKIKYKYRNKAKNYIPDILIEFIDNAKMLVEIKPKALTRIPINIAKMESAIDYCATRGIEYKLITEKELKWKS